MDVLSSDIFTTQLNNEFKRMGFNSFPSSIVAVVASEAVSIAAREFMRSRGVSLSYDPIPDNTLKKYTQAGVRQRSNVPGDYIEIPQPLKSRIPADYNYDHKVPEDVMARWLANDKAPRAVNVLVQPDTFAEFNCYVRLVLDTGRQFVTKSLAVVDSGAPCGGLIYAHDDPRINHLGSWREGPHSFFLDGFADVELAGRVFDHISIVRHKAWAVAGFPEPVIGGHLLAKMAVSLVGLDLNDKEFEELPEVLRHSGRGTVLIHNGSDEIQWIQAFLEFLPLALNQII